METMSNQTTENLLRSFLKKENFSLSKPKLNGDLGADIEATKGNLTYFIECIGYKRQNSARSKDFFEAFFRAISRLDNGAENIVIALPELYLTGMSSRLTHYKIGWKRLGVSFPELELWFISNEKITRFKWNDVYDKYLKN